MAAHGVALRYVDELNNYLDFYRKKRNERNAKMCELITNKFSKFGIELNFENDVLPLSMASEGGSVTERHLLYALAVKLYNRFNQSEELINFLTGDLNLSVNVWCYSQECVINSE